MSEAGATPAGVDLVLDLNESTGNLTPPYCAINATNCTWAGDSEHQIVQEFETILRICVAIIFGSVAVVGFLGNLLVIIVVVSNRQMRNTTNLLIINLAVADLLFIIICVPFTAIVYCLPNWPFGNAWCKIYQYMVNVTAYASVYTLVLMSFDRYLAVVHPIRSMTIRNERNAYIVIFLSWIAFFLLNLHVVVENEVVVYDYLDEVRSTCGNPRIMADEYHGQLIYGCFFVFSYLVPLLTVCVLYGFLVKRLMFNATPGGSKSSVNSKKRVTRMVVIVVLIFALCWLPIHVIFLFKSFGTPNYPSWFFYLQIAATALAYMNSCVNPILYAFLSENFRKSFQRLLCGWGRFQPVRLEMERTTAHGLETMSRTTALNNNGNCV